MPKFKVYFECEEDPHVYVEANSEEEAIQLAQEAYNEDFEEVFFYGALGIERGSTGFFRASEAEEMNKSA